MTKPQPKPSREAYELSQEYADRWERCQGLGDPDYYPDPNNPDDLPIPTNTHFNPLAVEKPF